MLADRQITKLAIRQVMIQFNFQITNYNSDWNSRYSRGAICYNSNNYTLAFTLHSLRRTYRYKA